MRAYVVTGVPLGSQEAAARRADTSMLARYAGGLKRRKNFGGPGSLASGGAHQRVRGQRVEVFVGAEARQLAETQAARFKADGLVVTLRRWRMV